MTEVQRGTNHLPGLLYGGDYNPEQWPEEVWLEDVRLMQAAGVNCVSLAIFSWAKLEPRPGEHDFAWLDRIIDLLHAHGIRILLATATASPPPWFSKLYPDSLPVDRNGQRYKPGSRQHYCPNNEAYRQSAAALAGKMAARYGEHPAVLMWHVNNEYACHVHECFCERCRDTFRGWLQERYSSLDALNDAWGTQFWSQRYGAWDEIELPVRTPTFVNPGQMLDYRRFMNASILRLFRSEIDAIRATGATQPLFANMVFDPKWLDQFEWAQYADYTAVDAYPDPSLGEYAWISAAFVYDLMRSANGNKPFLLIEQTATQVNWRPVNQLKPPGMMRALSYQAVARGSDSVMFFQWRASKAGAEKFHAGMVPHGGVGGNRVFGEISQLGAELKQLGAVIDSRMRADVGLLFSFENVWALEIGSKPAQIDAVEAILPWHAALAGQNIPVDIVHPGADLSAYKVLVAPLLYQISQSQADNLRRFVERGGALILSYFSGIADERDHIWLGGYPGLLKDVLGLEVEEWQPLLPDQAVRFEDVRGEQSSGTHWAEVVRVGTAEVLARLTDGWMSGQPAICRNRFGNGLAYYAATRPAPEYLGGLLREICAGQGVHSLADAPFGVEVTERNAGDVTYLFVINHTDRAVDVHLRTEGGEDVLTGERRGSDLQLEPYQVQIIAR